MQQFLIATGAGLVPVAILSVMFFFTLEREDRSIVLRHPVSGLRGVFARQNDPGEEDDDLPS